MQVVQPGLAIAKEGKSVLQVGFARSDGLYLCAGQLDPGFVGLQDLVLEAGAAILHQGFDVGIHSHTLSEESFVHQRA
jgi:hypothetical protein